MTPARFRELVERLFASDREHDTGLSAFARWLPLDGRQVRRYALDETKIPPAIARLLELLDARRIAPAEVPDRHGKVRPRP